MRIKGIVSTEREKTAQSFVELKAVLVKFKVYREPFVAAVPNNRLEDANY